MIFDSQGTRKDERAAEAEVILSALLAFSMILLALFPVAGKILCLISACLFILFYSAQGFRLIVKIIHSDETLAYDWINYFVAIVSLTILAVNILWLGNSLLPGLITMTILLLILFLNYYHKHTDIVRNDHYTLKQIRLIMLIVIAGILIFTEIY